MAEWSQRNRLSVNRTGFGLSRFPGLGRPIIELMFEYTRDVRRRLCDHPVEVDLGDGRPVRFRRGEREYEVVTLLKSLSLIRPQDGIDTQLWQVRARRPGFLPRVYELRCDHGEWRMTAIWT